MKLLFVVDHFSMQGSGMENDAVNLCIGLSKLGHEIHVCCNTGTPYLNIQLHHDIAHFEEIKKQLQADLVIDWNFLIPADVYRIGGGIHEIYLQYYLKSYPSWLQWIKKLEFKFKKKHQKQILLEKQLTHTPNSYFSAISQMIADQLLSYGVKKEFIQVAFNGIDLEKYRPLPLSVREKQRQAWGIKENEFVALFVTHNLRLKNLNFAIKVIKELNLKGIPFKLAVCGKRRPKTLNSQIIYVGTTPELEKFYNAADILLHPSCYDSFGNIILEAMACQIPAITVDSVGASELITPQDKVFLTRPLDEVLTASGSQIWVKLITQILKAPQKKELLEAKRAFVEEHCSLPLFVQKFSELLEKALHNKNA